MNAYENPGPTVEAVRSRQGRLILEFGVDWCPHCLAAQPLMEAALGESPGIPLVQVEDGRGRALGRAFKVKLWPTFILLRDGVELGRLVRPVTRQEVDQALSQWGFCQASPSS
ncbi:MAG: thioredoxin family protein [Betaproteobacteria bacterium]|nr:thioredoxin family protein [Betaproteobacteria bacterium]MDE2622937.1 thioredoxin family protein [Betaproteobacteria bacterium]